MVDTFWHSVAQAPEEDSLKTSKKGRLAPDIHLVLHTRAVQSLCKGSRRESVTGLLAFASWMQRLWQAVKQDDPYAEWYILKLYDQLNQIRDAIKAVEMHGQQQLSKLRGLEVQLFTHTDPLKVPLRFGSPFSYMAAYVLGDLDYALRQTFTLERLGIVLDPHHDARKFFPEFRKFFGLARQWKATAVTRQDIIDNTEKAKKAQLLMGDVPLPILNKQIKLKFLTDRR